MGIEIFRHESGATETWLVVNDDGPVTYVTENTGWRMATRHGKDGKQHDRKGGEGEVVELHGEFR